MGEDVDAVLMTIVKIRPLSLALVLALAFAALAFAIVLDSIAVLDSMRRVRDRRVRDLCMRRVRDRQRLCMRRVRDRELSLSWTSHSYSAGKSQPLLASPSD